MDIRECNRLFMAWLDLMADDWTPVWPTPEELETGSVIAHPARIRGNLSDESVRMGTA